MSDGNGLQDKRIVMTGATNGIGLAAAHEFAKRGAGLAILARDETRGRAAAASIKAAAGGGAEVDILHVDLASQASIRGVAGEILERYDQIDVLINNAGVVFAGRRLSPDGIELTWAVNHLAPFLLTSLLLDRIKACAPARIITTSSDANRGGAIPWDDFNAERSYGMRGFARYSATKLANILFTVELARRLSGTGVTANCFHPGTVATGFNRNNGPLMALAMTIMRPFSRSPEKGAETLIWLAEAPELTTETAGYYVDMRRVAPSPAAQDAEAARRLWEISEEQVGLASPSGV
jgi:NAD(P)-dependent dehydrogenase (short-subunit alcohol dehydrogenase family)